MRKILGALIVWSLLFPGLVSAQTDLNGVLKRNHFTSDKWIASSSNVIVNTTSTYLMLEEYNGSNGGLYEDLTNYTEFEESLNYITNINETHVRARCDLEYGRYLGYDFGDGFWENFTIRYAVYVNGIGNSYLNDVHYFHLNNLTSFGDRSDITGTVDSFFEVRVLNDNDGDNYDIQLFSRTENTDIVNSGEEPLPELYNNWIYVEVFKEGGFVGINVFNDPGYSEVLYQFNDTHTTSHPITYRFLYPVNSVDIGSYSGWYIDVWVKNVDLMLPAELYWETGSLYTTDLLENASMGSIAYSFYGAGGTPDFTSLEVYLSEDNSTWTLWDNDQEFPEIVYSYNYSSLYAWFRLNSTNGLSTPYVNFYHVFYEASLSTSETNWGISLILLVIGFIVGLGSLMRRES